MTLGSESPLTHKNIYSMSLSSKELGAQIDIALLAIRIFGPPYDALFTKVISEILLPVISNFKAHIRAIL